ncbi:MAG: dihydrofolate reductase, partial [Pseudomonadota bacterium]
VEDAISMAYGAGHARIYGIGGAGIYRSMLPLADRLLITEVDLQVEAPDTWFPDVDPATWRVARQWPLREDAPRCTLLEFLRAG